MRNRFIKSFKKKHKQVKKKSRFLLRHPLIIPATTFIVMFIGGLFALVLLGATTGGPADTRIVSVFADGEQRTVTTRAKTVEDLVQRLEIKIIDEDIVEPARESPILESGTKINIYRARPVEVRDGDRILTLLTAQRAPRLVAIEAGLKILPEDEVSFQRLDPDALESSVSEQLSVKRSKEIQLNLYGVLKKLRTTSDTVEELLIQEGVKPEEDETVEPSATTTVTAGMLVSVNRPGVKTAAVTEKIPYEVQTVDDDTLQAGKSQVKTAGIEGEQAVVYEIEEDDAGNEISRKQIQVVVLSQPAAEIVARGTKIVAPSFNPSVTVAGDKAALMAAAGIAESDFGYVDFIISHESGWRPGAVNSSSGAYGLCQSLPASKMASAGADYLTNPVTQLRWCSGYAAGRYGGWGGAYNAWQVQRWW